MKKALVILACILAVLIHPVNTYVQRELKDNMSSDSLTIQSNLCGDWYCNRVNSCNDMDIHLQIAQDGNTVYFDRNMVSDSGVGGSRLYGKAEIDNENEAYADYTQGTYIVMDRYLIELFPRNSRWNIYTRDAGSNEPIEYRYQSFAINDTYVK